MVYLMGEGIQLGLGIESAAARGTSVTPTIWVPGRAPTTINANVKKKTVKETLGSGAATMSSEIFQSSASGDLSFNVRVESIGYFLRSLLGASTPVVALGATTHTFTQLVGNPVHTSLTLALAQPNFQDYAYVNAVVSKLNLKVSLDDLVNATASFLAISEATHADYTPAFSATDVFFRQFNTTIKLAANVAGLGAAPALCVQSLDLTIDNHATEHQCIGSQTANEVLVKPTDVNGSMKIDYTDTTNHITYNAGTYQAMSITFERTDLAVLGTSALKPKITFTFPKISFEDLTNARPIDGLVSDDIKFVAHYDTTLAYQVQVVVQNTVTDYYVA